MRAPAQTPGSQRAVTVLAVLFGLLLGGGSLARAGVDADTRLARADQVQLSKAAVRAGARIEMDDAAELEPFLPADRPRIRTEVASVRPGAAGTAVDPAASAALHPLPYRARAPPAA
jgi:hypothetical protein